jgi:hypothetical protein
LALGIGATTAVFTALNPILFQPLPYPHAGRLVMVQELGRNGSPRLADVCDLSGVGRE